MRDILREDYEKRDAPKQIDTIFVSAISESHTKEALLELQKEQLESKLETLFRFNEETNEQVFFENYGSYGGPLSFWFADMEGVESGNGLFQDIEAFNRQHPNKTIDISEEKIGKLLNIFLIDMYAASPIADSKDASWEKLGHIYVPNYYIMLREIEQRNKQIAKKEIRGKQIDASKEKVYSLDYLTELALKEQMQRWKEVQIYLSKIPLGVQKQISFNVESVIKEYEGALSKKHRK